MLRKLIKTLRPLVSVVEDIVIKSDETILEDSSLLVEKDFGLPNLKFMHDFLARAIIGEELTSTVAPIIYGEDWNKLLTMDEARKYIDKWLEDNRLDIGQSSFNLLSENRREPYTDYAMKTRRFKGNRHIYGRLPCIQAKRTIFQQVLKEWLEENVKPLARSINEAS